MEPSLQFLFELIQFDMQQIQNYREAIFNISVTIIVASFGISAFVYRKDNPLSPATKSAIIISTNVVLLIVAFYLACYYEDKGLKFTRNTLELREIALKDKLFKDIPLSSTSLYPDRKMVVNHMPGIKSLLERIPLYIAIILLFIKAVVEVIVIVKGRKDQTQQINPADAKNRAAD